MEPMLDVLLRLILGEDSPAPIHADGRINYDLWFMWAKERVAADRLRAEAAEGRVCAMREARLKRNTAIHDDPHFEGRWVAVPEVDFDKLEAALSRWLTKEG